MRTYLRKINYYETDKMGVVHHSNYFRFFEEARTYFMEEAGYPYPRLEEEGIISPVIAISCEYKHPLRYGDTAAVDVHLVSMTKFRCTFTYEVRSAATGELRATGKSEHCYLGGDGRPVNIQRTHPDFYTTFLAELEAGETG